MTETYDVLIAGGGAAGLSAATTLSRARRSVLLVDAGSPRNAPADGVHNYLAREGTPPADLLAAGRAEVTGYGGEIVAGTVVSAERLAGPDPRFRVLLDDGRAVTARRLLLATGLTDVLPDVPGLTARWGRDVLHCPYCHGYEVRDRAVAILADGPFGPLKATLFRQWCEDVTLVQHSGPDLDDEQRERLAARDVRVVRGEVTGLEVTADELTGLRLRSGEVVPCGAVVVSPRMEARLGPFAALGLGLEEQRFGDHLVGRHLPTGPGGATAVPGVWAAGNVTDLQAQVVVSAAAGLTTAAAINVDLIEEDVRHAVAARRAAGTPSST